MSFLVSDFTSRNKRQERSCEFSGLSSLRLKYGVKCGVLAAGNASPRWILPEFVAVLVSVETCS